MVIPPPQKKKLEKIIVLINLSNLYKFSSNNYVFIIYYARQSAYAR